MHVDWLGRVPYLEALQAQRERREAILQGDASEVLWLLEHDPVITTGRRGVVDLPSTEVLTELGLDVVPTERGGLATWHGPGQLVGYLLCELHRLGLKVRTLVAALEEGVSNWLATQGVSAGGRAGYPGVWVGSAKICALGLHFRRGVSMHGFALNLTNDLEGFALITPCGITDGGVTTLSKLCGRSSNPAEAAIGVGEAIVAALLRASGSNPH